MSLAEAFRRVVPTPIEYRTWIPRAAARGILRCTEPELDALQAAGLASSGDFVERYDIWNTGYAEGALRSRGEREMVFFNRLLRSHGSDWVSAREYRITAVSECPRGPQCTDGVWGTPRTPAATWAKHTAAAGTAEWTGRITMAGAGGAIQSPTVQRVWAQFLDEYRFQFTSMELAADLGQTRSRKVGDCSALSRVLCEELSSAGRPAQVRAGYIFGGARTRWHRWVSVLDEDGSTRHLDPAMALLADTFFTPEYREFCAGGLLNRIIPLESEEQFFVRHTCRSQEQQLYVVVSLRSL